MGRRGRDRPGEFGKLNVLVNDAGTVALGQLKNFDLAKWQKVIDVNLTGTFLGSGWPSSR